MTKRLDVRVFTQADGSGGNPLAIIYNTTLDTAGMQTLAREMNYSETVFIDVPHRKVRIFTPITELSFAGHPTVGSAWFMQQQTGSASFRVPMGELQARVNGAHAEIIFPGLVTLAEDELSESLKQKLSLESSDVLRVFSATAGPTFKVVELNSKAALDRATTSFGHPENTRVYLFFRESATQVHARMFGISLPEDAATGSAACALAGQLRADGHSGKLNITQGVQMGSPSALTLMIGEDIRLGGLVHLL